MTGQAREQLHIYDIVTGRIKRTVRVVLSDVSLQLKAGESVFDGDVDARIHYIVDGIPPIRMDREVFAGNFDSLTLIADEIDIITLIGLPLETTIIENQTILTVNDGVFEFAANISGQYKIQFKHPHFLNKEWIINAN